MISLLLRLYPRTWRERYGTELRSLVEDTGLTAGAAVDLTRGAINEWAVAARDALNGGTMMVIGPAYRHPRPWALIGLVLLAPTLLFTLLSMLTYQFGLTGLASVMDPVNAWLNGQRVLDLILVALPGIALLVAAAPLIRVELRNATDGREAVFGLRLKAFNVLVVLLALLIGGLLVGHIVFENVLQVGA